VACRASSKVESGAEERSGREECGDAVDGEEEGE